MSIEINTKNGVHKIIIKSRYTVFDSQRSWLMEWYSYSTPEGNVLSIGSSDGVGAALGDAAGSGAESSRAGHAGRNTAGEVVVLREGLSGRATDALGSKLEALGLSSGVVGAEVARLEALRLGVGGAGASRGEAWLLEALVEAAGTSASTSWTTARTVIVVLTTKVLTTNPLQGH
jgi:hypothetical protein